MLFDFYFCFFLPRARLKGWVAGRDIGQERVRIMPRSSILPAMNLSLGTGVKKSTSDSSENLAAAGSPPESPSPREVSLSISSGDRGNRMSPDSAGRACDLDIYLSIHLPIHQSASIILLNLSSSINLSVYLQVSSFSLFSFLFFNQSINQSLFSFSFSNDSTNHFLFLYSYVESVVTVCICISIGM